MYKVQLEPNLYHIFEILNLNESYSLKKDYYNTHKRHIKRLIDKDDGTKFCEAVEKFFHRYPQGKGKKKVRVMRYIKDLISNDVIISTKGMSITLYGKELSITKDVYKFLFEDIFDDTTAFEPHHIAAVFDLLKGEFDND